MKPLHPITAHPTVVRGEDDWGSGAFGAPRGERTHRGIDIAAAPGEPVLSPCDGEVVREAAPYDDDPHYSGLLLHGRGDWEGCAIKLFYLTGPHEGFVQAGEVIGHAQDIAARYPGITGHIHIEVRLHGEIVDPTPLFTA
jgi:murein DD-endopeptidase MepM/ murein hydrolase activator NlpD